jgi:hypothetical protein
VVGYSRVCVGHRTSNFVRGTRNRLLWRLMRATRERLPRVDRGSDGAWSIERASGPTGGGSAGWKLGKSTCEMSAVRAVTTSGLETPGPLPVLLSERSQTPRCGSPEAFQIRLPADRGTSTATAALPEAVDPGDVGVPRAERLPSARGNVGHRWTPMRAFGSARRVPNGGLVLLTAAW